MSSQTTVSKFCAESLLERMEYTKNYCSPQYPLYVLASRNTYSVNMDLRTFEMNF